MSSTTLTSPAVVARAFPAAEVRRRLQQELQQAADESAILRPAWQPLLDSVRMVAAVVALEDLFPFKLPPEKIVRRGGDTSVDGGVEYILEQLGRLWNDHSKPKERS